MRDIRGSEQVNAAAGSEDPQTARAGLIAQYRMRVTPDAKRTMALFNRQMLDVWYQESGVPQRDADGNRIWRREPGLGIMERGLKDFDYATYVREGIKQDWVRQNDDTLTLFFGVPWKVQRRECVPELVKLLEHPNKKVRWWAVLCLTRTVLDKDRPRWAQYEKREDEELAKWREWWKKRGDSYMKGPGTQPPKPDASPPHGGND